MKKKGCGSCLLNIILTIVAIAAIASIFNKTDINTTSEGDKTFDTSVSFEEMSPDTGSSYDQLSDIGKDIYSRLVIEIAAGNLSFSMENVEYDAYIAEFFDALTAVTYDHPEFFWINGGYSAKGLKPVGSNNDTINATLTCYNYWTYTVDPDKYILALQKKVDEVSAMAAAYPTTYEKVKFVHDYLVTTVDYDHTAAEEANKTVRQASSEHAYSAYGCLVNQKAVCGGYAKAFQLIMNSLGIDCSYVTGQASGGLHAWNYIKLDGEYYYMDITWDDSNLKNDDGTHRYPLGVEYDYFCITTDQLLQTHIPDDTFDVPYCGSTEYNYFIREGLYLEAYDRTLLSNAIEKVKDQQIISIRFSSLEELLKAKDDLITNKNWNKVSAFSGLGTISYVCDEQHLVFAFYINK